MLFKLLYSEPFEQLEVAMCRRAGRRETHGYPSAPLTAVQVPARQPLYDGNVASNSGGRELLAAYWDAMVMCSADHLQAAGGNSKLHLSQQTPKGQRHHFPTPIVACGGRLVLPRICTACQRSFRVKVGVRADAPTSRIQDRQRMPQVAQACRWPLCCCPQALATPHAARKRLESYSSFVQQLQLVVRQSD